jgi:hypothetical protein
VNPTGPIYCETGHPFLFMAEPVNTVTNIFIVISAILALRHVRRARIGMPLDLAVLLFLLFATGIGSFFWHAFRTRAALAFDAIPGLLFLIVFAGLWFRALFGNWAGIAGAFGLIGTAFGSIALAVRLIPGLRQMPQAISLVPAYATISAIGIALAAISARRLGTDVARLGVLALACAVIAATSRSIDLMMCPVVPFGTHGLWHIFLSLAAYLAIALLVRIKVETR